MSAAEYLIVDEYLQDALQARALDAAFQLGLIDVLAAADGLAVSALLAGRDCDETGGRFLLDMLQQANVVTIAEQSVRLTDGFRNALRFRDLLTARLTFAALVAEDYFAHLPQLLRSSEDFMAVSKLFEIFDYGRCLDISPENCLHASRWMQLTSALTRYEAPVCQQFFDFSQFTHLLDVGGNSGEFALQICRRTPQLRATVFDLPVVCHVGQRHLQQHPEADRISFRSGNMLADAFPADVDLISWKSVLHDWPDEHVSHLLQKSFAVLPADGQILIFERQPLDFSRMDLPYGLLPVMLFLRSYRHPDVYSQLLTAAGFADIRLQTIQLEVPFMLVTARKSASPDRPNDRSLQTVLRDDCNQQPDGPPPPVHDAAATNENCLFPLPVP